MVYFISTAPMHNYGLTVKLESILCVTLPQIFILILWLVWPNIMMLWKLFDVVIVHQNLKPQLYRIKIRIFGYTVCAMSYGACHRIAGPRALGVRHTKWTLTLLCWDYNIIEIKIDHWNVYEISRDYDQSWAWGRVWLQYSRKKWSGPLVKPPKLKWVCHHCNAFSWCMGFP